MDDDKLNSGEHDALRKVTLSHRRGEIDDLQFHEQSDEILGGRDFPILTSEPQSPSKISSEREQILKDCDAKDLDRLTTCAQRSVRARRTHIQKQRDEMRESIVAKEKAKVDKELFPETTKRPKVNFKKDSLIIEDNLSGTALTNIALQHSIILEIKKDKIKNYALSMLAVFGLILLAALIGFSKPVENFVKQYQIERKLSGMLAESDRNSSGQMIRPMLGALAVHNCTNACEGNGGKDVRTCTKACKQLELAHFARRITLDTNSPSLIAKRINKRCALATKSATSTTKSATSTTKRTTSTNKRAKGVQTVGDATSSKTIDPWDIAISRSQELLNFDEIRSDEENFKNITLMQSNLQQSFRVLSQNATLNSNQDGQALAKHSLQAVCLKTHKIIAQLGSVVSQNNKDTFSQGFYAKLSNKLDSQLQQEKIAIQKVLPTPK